MSREENNKRSRGRYRSDAHDIVDEFNEFNPDIWKNLLEDKVMKEDDFNLNALAPYLDKDELTINELYIG